MSAVDSPFTQSSTIFATPARFVRSAAISRRRVRGILRTCVPCFATARKPEPKPYAFRSNPKKHWPGLTPRKCVRVPAGSPFSIATVKISTPPETTDHTELGSSSTIGLCARKVLSSPSLSSGDPFAASTAAGLAAAGAGACAGAGAGFGAAGFATFSGGMYDVASGDAAAATFAAGTNDVASGEAGGGAGTVFHG